MESLWDQPSYVFQAFLGVLIFFLILLLLAIHRKKKQSKSSHKSTQDRTLRVLERTFCYLAWQMKSISKQISRSVSNSSLDSTASLYSWAPSSARGVSYSLSRTPPSAAPVALQQVPVWQRHLTKPYRTGFQQPHPRSYSCPPVFFQLHQKPKQRGRTPLQSECLTKRIPRVTSTGRSSPIPLRRLEGEISFLDHKKLELLDWHVHKKHGQKKAPPFPQVRSRETKVQVAIIPQNDMMLCVSQQLSTGPRSRSHTPPSGSPKSHKTPPKSPPAKVRSPGPCICLPVPSPKELLPPPLMICQTSTLGSLKALTDGKVSSMTPKEELGEVLSLLGQNKSLLTKQPGRPRTPKGKEKDVHSSASNRRPSTPKKTAGRPGSPRDKPAEVQVSLMLDRKTHQLSWVDDMTEVPKLSGELLSTALPPFLDPAFMCQNNLELPCSLTAQVDLHYKSHKLAKSLPKPQCLAHAIVESLDKEQAIRDVHMCLTKGLEKEHSQPGVEYPVCLLCGCCTPYCPHPYPQHGPCLLVYPRLSVWEGEVYMTLGFLLKMKRHEASKWGLVRGKDASRVQLSKEHHSKQERSHSRSRNIHEAAPPSRAPEKSSHLAKQRSTIDLTARRHRAGSRPSGAKTPKTSPHSSEMEPQPEILKPAPDAVQPKIPPSPPSILKKLLLGIRKAWVKVFWGKELPSTKQRSKTSLQKSAPSKKPVGPSTASGSRMKAGILLNKQDSLLKAARTPTHSKQEYSHGHKKVSIK